MRLIDADELLNDLIFPTEQFKRAFTELLNDAPTIKAEPPKHGRWKGAGMGDYMCSLCAEVVSGNRYHYCPNCGADMRGKE